MNIDAPSVADEDEAVVLMLHHLRLAAAYFEATPKAITLDFEDFSQPAIVAWIAAMEALYPDD